MLPDFKKSFAWALNFFALSNLSPKAFAAGFLGAAIVLLFARGFVADCDRALGDGFLLAGFVPRLLAAFGSSAGINEEADEPIK